MFRISLGRLMRRPLLAAPLVAATVIVGCGTSSAVSNQSHVLRTAFSFDQGPLDPDIFYDAEGLSITLQAYEGLVRYKNDSTPTIEPWLASSYEESADGLTYTFHLRGGVLFHDGTTMDSSTWKYDFQRRTAVNGGPAYMVANVKSMDTPDPQTFVVHLSQPVSAFLHYMASPYGPKAISPTALKANTVKNDSGQAWLASHDAGTGPYMLTNVVPATTYEMKAFDKYWGEKPWYTTVDITQIPSFTTQQLELRSGTLDVLMHGVITSALPSFKNDSKFQVQEITSIVRLNLWINPHLPPFTDQNVRLAVAQAVDRKSIIPTVFGDTSTVANSMFTIGALPSGKGVFDPQLDPSVLKGLVGSLSTKKVDLAYTTDDPLNAQVAELVQTQLSAAGLDVTTRGVTEQTTFAWPTNPQGRANMLILPANPDDADASAWATLFYAENGGLSYFAPHNPDADGLVNKGLAAVDPAAVVSAYTQAADAYKQSGDFIPLADEKEVAVARAGICGWFHDFSTLWTVRIQYLKPC
jgi:peptide/nickel transport system substrate-binding protein